MADLSSEYNIKDGHYCVIININVVSSIFGIINQAPLRHVGEPRSIEMVKQ